MTIDMRVIWNDDKRALRTHGASHGSRYLPGLQKVPETTTFPK